MLPLLAAQRDAALARLPSDAAAYYATGSGARVTRDEAESAWSAYRLRPRVLRDVAEVDLGVDLLGTRYATPIGVAPTAFHGLADPDGERATAAAAASAGPFVLSTRSSTPIEDVAAVAGPWWFQVYVMRDRGLTTALVERAAAAGARALVLTGDTPYVGRSEGLTGDRITLPDSHVGVNVSRHLAPGGDLRRDAGQDPSVTLEAISWLAATSGLPVLVKGVLRGDDADACLDAGAAGVVVSTHGGRQLDRAVSSARALPEVVDRVAGRAPVLVDGGLRSGTDVLVGLALGADAVLLGRPALWALAADGRAGVETLLAAMADDLAHACALAGVASVAELDRSFVTST